MKQLYLFGLLLSLPFFGFSQTDYEFWFAAPALTHQFVSPSPVLYQNLNKPIKLAFTTAVDTAYVTITMPAIPSFAPINVIVTNVWAKVVNLTSFIDSIENTPADTVLDRGIHITSQQPITAAYEVESSFNAETWPLLGKNAIGYEFIIPSQHHYENYLYSNPPARNTFDIVATEDSTTVRIVPKVALVGHVANDTFSIHLNRAQTWSGSAVSETQSAHLAGTFVFADKPVAVTMSDDVVYIPGYDNMAMDVAGAQLIPRHLSGTEFIVKAYGWVNRPKDKIYVYAYQDSTVVSYNDSVHIYSRLINRGDSIEFIMNYDTATNNGGKAYIQSNKPILVYHIIIIDDTYSGGPTAQIASAIVPPLSCGGSRMVTFTRLPPKGKWPAMDMFIVTKKENITGFTVLPSWMPVINPAGFGKVPGTGGEWRWISIGQGGDLMMGATMIITNSIGRFQVFTTSTCYSTDTASYAKMGYISDFSTLYLGVDRKMCQGDSSLLDAGYGRDTYLWNNGDTTQTIWAKSAGTYWVHTTEVGNCNLSDTINIYYYPFTPINLGPTRHICIGDSTLLNAGPGRNWYQWSTGALTQSIWVKTTGTYWVSVPDVHCTISDTIQVATTPVPIETNNPLNKTICSGQSTNIPLSSSVTGATFHWTATLTSGNITGLSADSGLVINQILTNLLSTAGTVTYQITPKYGSCVGSPVNYVVTVNPGDSVKVSITASANTICAGTPVTFTATPTNPGLTPVYSWQVNGGNVGTNSTTYTYTPVNGDVVKCILTSSLSVCISNNPATSNSIVMVVNPNLPVSVTLTSAPAIVCSGSFVTFTAHPTNGGTTPSYVWKVNGIGVGTNSDTYSFIPVNGDLVSCTLSSSETCTINNPASIQYPVSVNQMLPVSVTISASPAPSCPGQTVTFTATPIYGGTTPSYQWFVNSNPVGTNSNTYSYIPSNGDLVSCTLTSSEICTTNNPASSLMYPVSVSLGVPVSITITASANPFCPGSPVTFTATPNNGGSSPTYQWKVNGINVGVNSSTYTYNPNTNDSVRCIINSNLSCVTGNPASSSEIIMNGTLAPIVTFTACFDTITTVNAKPIRLKGGIPLNGTYSGPGVNSITSLFTPSVAGTGTKTVSYSYTNSMLCSASKSIHIIVQATPVFSCGNMLNDIRDSKTYQTVQIGSQCWMAEDLNYGIEIPYTQDQRDNCIAEYFRNASHVTRNAYYQWDELMQYDATPADQGFCPPGWHVPTENDWNVLFANYTGSGLAGSPLKTSGFSGFNALLSGMRDIKSSWDLNGVAGFYWSSTPYGSAKAWAHGMNEVDPSVSRYPALRVNAFSVRCIQD